MFGHTPLYTAMFQLAKCHSFKDNYDELSGLPLAQEKHDWEEITQLLRKAGARAPGLSFYYNLTGELPSPYLSNGKAVKLNKSTTPRETLRAALGVSQLFIGPYRQLLTTAQLGAYVPEVEEEFVPSYLKGKTQAKKPVFEEEDDMVAVQPPRKKKFEWSEPVSASLPRSPVHDNTPTFNFPIPQENPFTVAATEKKATTSDVSLRLQRLILDIYVACVGQEITDEAQPIQELGARAFFPCECPSHLGHAARLLVRNQLCLFILRTNAGVLPRTTTGSTSLFAVH